MSNAEKFDCYAIIEVMGHKKFAGRVTEGPFGLVQIDVPEVTLSSGQLLPPFSKMLGAHAIYAMTPCTEETARAFARDFRSQAFHSYELPALPAPKPAPERDPEWDAEDDDPHTNFCEDCGVAMDSMDVYCEECQEERDDEAADVAAESDTPAVSWSPVYEGASELAAALGVEPLPITPVPECSRKYVSGKACLLCGDSACFQIAARPDLDPDDGEPF